MTKPRRAVSTVKNFIDSFNFATFVIAMSAATAALWLNSKYVDRTTYGKDREILLLKVDNLEKETESIRFLVSTNEARGTELKALIIKIERLISKLITDDGEIIPPNVIRQLEIDIAEIKRDIIYIKNLKTPTIQP
jgi:hypothetical protein